VIADRYDDNMSFSADKVYILTGASMGFGRAVALAMADKGCGLVLNARTPDPLLETVEACRESTDRFEHVIGSAADEPVCRELVEKAMGLGDYGGFIHAAGVFHPGPYIWELDKVRADEIVGANFTAALNLVRFGVPPLLDQGGGLAVFVGSGASQLHNPGIGVYSAAKAAEEHLALQLAVEAPGIVSFVYRPGLVDTRMQQQGRRADGGASQRVRTEFKTFMDQGMLLSPEESARAFMIALENASLHHGRIADARDILNYR
jgi:NAD(P)-dependent dehydrogenase (short-subunit alcohol dehydrogenase family)